MLWVLTGPPAGGKSTWVRGRAQPGDVVVDFDTLAVALSGPREGDTHGHPEAVRQVTHRARIAAIREALRHVRDVDVYVIHSMPSAEWLATYAEHSAEIITIDPGRDVVMERIARERPASAKGVATRWYNQAATQGTRGQGRGGRPQGAGAPTPHPPCTPPPRTSRSW
ncbi:AAA family ATPase [Nonomuraea sp. NPDC050404]|uniref:AAA family ATPase n=1 Tax=Nonomuraea sp. NPDC050404 TaxID=3155783 RepID=UPI0033FF0F45